MPTPKPACSRNLNFHLNSKVSALSKGTRTKLGLLLNLCRHSEFLILDEPNEGLDPVMTEQMLQNLVRQAADGTTIFFSSHQVAEVEQIADYIIAIEKGRVILEGSLDHLRKEFRRVNLYSITLLRRRRSEVTVWSGSSRKEEPSAFSRVATSTRLPRLDRCLPRKSVDVQPVGLKELFLEKVKEDHANS